jgi:hypothetical protein
MNEESHAERRESGKWLAKQSGKWLAGGLKEEKRWNIHSMLYGGF